MATLILALADCLEALERNSAGLEGCIPKYPDYQEELGVLLRLAATLKRAPAVAVPRDGFLDDLRSRLMKESTIHGAGGGEAK